MDGGGGHSQQSREQDASNRWECEGSCALPEFGIRKIFEAATRLEAQGRDIIHLEIGRPDFDTPWSIKEAAKEALDRGEVHYTSNWGTLALRKAVSRRLKENLGVSYDPQDEILITVGTSEALFLIMAAYLRPGDGIMVPSPGYPTYWGAPLRFGARPRPLRCPGSREFQPVFEETVDPSCRALVMSSPVNPTGALWDLESLEAGARLARRWDMLVISDEIYSDIVFEGEHRSIVSLEGMRERTLVLDGVSKAYSMTGWRVGYVAGPRELIRPLYKLHQYNTACAVSFAQAGALAALESGLAPVTPMVEEFRRRRDFVVEALNRFPGVSCHCPRGAFYVFPDIRSLGMSSQDLAMYLLEEAGVATVPGSEFGPDGEGHIRISYASSLENLEEAMNRMEKALSRISRGRH